MTPRALLFVEDNERSPIFRGEWLDKDRRPAAGSPDTWVFLRYELDDGTIYELNGEDLDALHEAKYCPIWRVQELIS